MDDRLLEMYDWETLSPEHQLGHGELYGLESTVAFDQANFVQEETEQSPQLHEFETSEEDEQQKKYMTEECDQTLLNNIQNTSTLHLFDSTSIQLERMAQIEDLHSQPTHQSNTRLQWKTAAPAKTTKTPDGSLVCKI